MSDFDIAAYERAVQRGLDNPRPGELHQQIADEIEPVTINRHFKHDEAMSLIGIAYPLIRDFLTRNT